MPYMSLVLPRIDSLPIIMLYVSDYFICLFIIQLLFHFPLYFSLLLDTMFYFSVSLLIHGGTSFYFGLLLLYISVSTKLRHALVDNIT